MPDCIEDTPRSRTDIDRIDDTLEQVHCTLSDAANTLESIDLSRITEFNPAELNRWSTELRGARASLVRVFAQRGTRVPEPLTRGSHAVRFTPGRMQYHLLDLAKEIRWDLDGLSEAGCDPEAQHFPLLGIYFRLREVLQFLRWLHEQLGIERNELLESTNPGGKVPMRVRQALKELLHQDSCAVVAQSVSAERSPGPPQRIAVPDEAHAAAHEAPVSFLEPAVPGASPVCTVHPSMPALNPVVQPRAKDGVNLREYLDRPDERAAVLRSGLITVWHGCARGPSYAPHARSLDATHAVPVRDGVAFALGSGLESSPGSGAASMLVANTFCKLLATHYTPFSDARTQMKTATEWTVHHLDLLLRTLIDARDDAPVLESVFGTLPRENLLRILQNTLEPSPTLRHAPPALSCAFTGGLLRLNPELNVYELFIVRAGDMTVERKKREHHAENVPAHGGKGTKPLRPGAAAKQFLASLEVADPLILNPGEAILIGCSGLQRGHAGTAWEMLSQLGTGVDHHWDGPDERVLTILRGAVSAAESLDRLEELRMQERIAGEAPALPSELVEGLRHSLGVERDSGRLFSDDLSMLLLSLDARAQVGLASATAPDVERRARPLPAPRVSAVAVYPAVSPTRKKLAGIIELLNRPL